MAYPKKKATSEMKKQCDQPKMSEERRQKLLALQQREELKGMLVNKFISKYGSKNKQQINKQVDSFMKGNKITEQNLQKLEQQIISGEKQEVKLPSIQGDQQSVVSKGSRVSRVSGSQQKADYISQQKGQGDQISCADSYQSSCKQKSLYELGDEDDEWATIIKFDQELYKKEKELQGIREQEQKRKMKRELDRQVQEKKRMLEEERQEMEQYNQMQIRQLELMDIREKERQDHRDRKVELEKKSRRRQLHEENSRKKQERKREEELDNLLVTRIKQELEVEQDLIRQKKQEERTHLQKVLKENAENKARLEEEAKQERLMDIQAQEEYSRLLEKQEKEREQELKNREARARAFMNMMSNTVVKEQQAALQAEEAQIIEHYRRRDEREKQEDQVKKQKYKVQQQQIREFLNQQVQEKEGKKVFERQLNQRQAEFWQNDTKDYQEKEKAKENYIKEVNLKHQEILRQQIQEKYNKTKKGKMNQMELFQNKAALKSIAQNDNNVHRNVVEQKQINV